MQFTFRWATEIKFVPVSTILMESLVTTFSKAMELTSSLCITLCQQYFLWYSMAGKIVLVFYVQPSVNTVVRISPLKLAKLSSLWWKWAPCQFFLYLLAFEECSLFFAIFELHNAELHTFHKWVNHTSWIRFINYLDLNITLSIIPLYYLITLIFLLGFTTEMIHWHTFPDRWILTYEN